MSNMRASFRAAGSAMPAGGLNLRAHLSQPAMCRTCLRRLTIVATYPIPETEKEPSTIDVPQEWVTPKPSKRPDIFPDLEKLETPLPNKLPGDPELPEDEEWEEEKKKLPEPDKKPPEPGEEGEEEEEDDEEGEEGDEDGGIDAPQPEE